MKREKLRRLLFVSAACLLSFPWLTPCVGIWSAAAVNGAHDSITQRDQPLTRLPTQQLKQWAAKPGPKLTVIERQSIPSSSLVTAAELSDANGGMQAPRPGTLAGKGASAVVDGLTYTLTWIDPFTWVSQNSMGMEPTKPRRRLVLSETPFVMLEGQDIRFIRDGKNRSVRLAKGTNARVTVITPDGTFIAHAQDIHFRGPSQEVLLEQPYSLYSGGQYLRPLKADALMKLNFIKRSVSCNGAIIEHRRH